MSDLIRFPYFPGQEPTLLCSAEDLLHGLCDDLSILDVLAPFATLGLFAEIFRGGSSLYFCGFFDVISSVLCAVENHRNPNLLEKWWLQLNCRVFFLFLDLVLG